MNTKPLWPKIGLLIAAGLAAHSVWGGGAPVFDTALRVQFAALLLHQFEEYVLPGGFAGFYNHQIYRKSPLTRWRINRAGVYLINIGLGWGVYGLGAFAAGLPVLAAGLALVHLLNAAAHIAMALFSGQRNPGVVTAVGVLIPCATWVLWLCTPRMDVGQWVWALLFLAAAVALIQAAIFLGSRLCADG